MTIAPPRSRPERAMAGAVGGIAVALLAYFLFATSDSIAKALTQRYSPFQIIPMQVTFALVPMTALVIREGGLRTIRPRHPWLIGLRGLLAVVGSICGFHAFALLPLADVYAIAFTTPILVTVLSVPILGEKVGPYRWGAVIVGFLGVMVMIRPGLVTLNSGHLTALLQAIGGAGVTLILRRIGREETRGTLVVVVLGSMLAVNLPILPFVYVAPSLADIGLSAASGLLMGGGQIATIQALRLAPAALIAPFQYSLMIWALIYGAVLFGDPPTPPVLAGAAIVVASALYTLHRERRRGRDPGAHAASHVAKP